MERSITSFDIKQSGRPPKFESVEQLQELINKYFLSCLSPIYVSTLNPDYDLEGDETKNEGIAKYIQVHKLDGNGNPMYEQVQPYTMSGLALALGTNRRTLLDYEKEVLTSFPEETRSQFSLAIKEARAKVEEYVERYMFSGKNQTSVIFNAKNNFDWVDRTERDLTTKGKSFNDKKLDDKADEILGDDQ